MEKRPLISYTDTTVVRFKTSFLSVHTMTCSARHGESGVAAFANGNTPKNSFAVDLERLDDILTESSMLGNAGSDEQR